jgi:Tn3 transposase DDE domain
MCVPASTRRRPVLAIREEHPGTVPPACSPPGLHASGRHSVLATALPGYGRLVRTICICRCVTGERTAAAVRRQLSNGRSRHALRRDLFVACQGHVRHCLGDRTGQAPHLTLITRAGVPWTTAYAVKRSTNRSDRRLIAAAAAASFGDESQPLDRSDGMVPGPIVKQAKEELSPTAARDFDSAGANNPIPEMADLRAEGGRPTRQQAAQSRSEIVRAKDNASARHGA